ncbi:fungal-specific transcription factor domain-containing protein [Daldinia caldariorum]|uniref:fungal-specific transcription factor domain-containing protein n=1 Tax=Daldinia caldariorum TaxID=326644 RepID=UPI002007A98B|nr:fungal-specific transcription factor domain-containing protein [Daldinia caldariorum]KAI1469960.1 fungal-specific transcription factor domain-containing protein [Daldinia caldariorum]
MPPTPESQLGDGSASNGPTPPAGFSVNYTPPNHPDSSMIKVTRGHSCVLCQQRKVRCDKSKPCSNCVKANVECRVVPPQPPRRRKKRVPERDLVERLRKYEALLAQNGIEFDSLGPDVKIVDPGSVEDGDELEPEFIRQRSKESPSGVDPELISSPGEAAHVPRTFKWFPFQKEATTDEGLKDSSDEEDVGSSINQAYDKMFDSPDGFPFVIGGQFESVTAQHPSAIQIFQLWQIYLNNVNPLLKLTHTPTLQVRIIEAGANLDKVSRSLEALMFSIYLMAITSIDDEECQATFNESRFNLLAKYYYATQQALLNAGFMRNPDLTLMQAFLLYLMGIRQYSDPRSLFCLTGIGVRLAQRMGLHRDGAQFNLSPFEVEERRRLWWNLAGFDRRIGELCGSIITAISNGGNCKLPLNIDDANLHLHAKDPPPPYTGATEMMFSLSRLEFAKAPGNDKMRGQSSETNPQAVASVADHRLSSYLERFSAHMEDTYLKYCDPKVPLHYMTLLMTRANMCKLKIVSGFFRVALTAPAPLPPAERDEIFVEAIKMIEYDTMMQSRESLKGFLWYTNLHFPFPAYICLLTELRHRTTGELCERAWETICEHADRRKMTSHMRSPMHLSFSPLFVKAWDAREAAEAALGRTLAPPRLITHMRQIAARLPKTTKKRSPAPTPSPKIPVISGAYVATAPTPPEQPNVPGAVPLYPEGDIFSGGMPQMDVNRQFAHAFPELNFGGEMDWNYLMQEYGGFVAHPPQMSAYANQTPMQDPNQPQPAIWQ